jgi:FkbM family methyltransferase
VRRLRLPLACNLGRDIRARLKILVLYAIFKSRARLGLGRARARRVGLRLGDRTIDWWVADRGDFELLVSVFILGEYDGPLPSHAELIVDLGAHVGASVVFWRQRYPGAEIVAVEPDPESFGRLRRHLAGDPRVRLVQAAVVERSGPARLVRSDLSWASHLARNGGEETIEVPGLSFTDLLEQVALDRRVDLLKVDIEGAESNVLASPLSAVSTLVVETHDSSGEPAEDALVTAVAAREGMRLVRTDWEAVSWLVRD